MRGIICISILFSILILISCRSYLISENEKEFDTKFSPSVLSSVSIDTTTVYKLYSSWTGSYEFNSSKKENFTIMDEVEDIYGSKSASAEFIRIHNNSKLSFYYLSNSDNFNCNLFNNQSSDIGIYDIHNQLIYTKRVLGIGHSGKLISGKAKIKRDTLYLIEKIFGRTQHSKYLRIECNISE